MQRPGNIKVLGLTESVRKAETFARFGKPIEKSDLVFLAGNGLQDAAHRALSCMGWIWRQWLLGTPVSIVSRHVEPFVARGLELRERSQSYDYLALHDLYLLHCAVFGCSDPVLNTVVERIADASGDKGKKPLDNGEIYAAAWCGMLKYWIIGNQEKAAEQFDMVWEARRESGILAAPKFLANPWLIKDWGAFRKAQTKDFERLWKRAQNDRWTVKAETSSETVVTTERYQIGHQWCWAHCGMALLAHRQGVDVITDPFWFPSAAFAEEAEPKHGTDGPRADQLDMF